jgi:hypothetical protein
MHDAWNNMMWVGLLAFTALVLSLYNLVIQLTVGEQEIVANSSSVDKTVLAIEQGGTGSSTAVAARAALGVVSTSDVIPISQGGTGATTLDTIKAALGIASTSTRVYHGTVQMSLEGSATGYLQPLGDSTGYMLIEPTEENPHQHEVLLYPLPGAGTIRNFFVRHASFSNSGQASAGIIVELRVGADGATLTSDAAFTHTHSGEIVDGSPILQTSGNASWSIPTDSLIVLYVDSSGGLDQLSGNLNFHFGFEFVPDADA